MANNTVKEKQAEKTSDVAAFSDENKILKSLHESVDEREYSAYERKDRAKRVSAKAVERDEDAKWIEASDGYYLSQSVMDEQGELRRIRNDPYRQRFDLLITNGDSCRKKSVYFGECYYSWDDRVIIGWADDSTPEKSRWIAAFRDEMISPFDVGENHYEINLRRYLKIENGTLKDTDTVFDRSKGDDNKITRDPFLMDVLREHRDNGKLVNIIASIDRRQDKIIRHDIDGNMIIQGCAGSGKTQILFHRLAYFRVGNKPVNWSKMQVISPGKAFRHHISSLIADLNIADVPNSTIEEFFGATIAQYGVKLSRSKYVIMDISVPPEQYLGCVYSDNNTQQILRALETRIKQIIDEVLSNSMVIKKLPPVQDFAELPLHEQLSRINDVLLQIELNDRSADLEHERKAFRDAEEKYIELKAELPALEKQFADIDRQLQALAERNDSGLKMLFDRKQQIMEQYKRAESEFQARRQAAEERLLEETRNNQRKPLQSQTSLIPFQEAVHAYQTGNLYHQHQENLKSWRNKADECDTDFQTQYGISGISIEDYMEKHAEQVSALLAERKHAQRKKERIDGFEARLSYFSDSIGKLERQSLSPEQKLTLSSNKMLLNRLELQLFEQVVSSELSPAKEKYEVRATHGKKQILYRRDLFFLLHICIMCRGPLDIDKTRMILVDEGQNLSQSEYELLFAVFPNAVWNILGDIRQCIDQYRGLKKWSLGRNFWHYELTENYRNPREITEYVAETLGAKMRALGLEGGTIRKTSFASVAEVIREYRSNNGSLAIIVSEEVYFKRLRAMLEPEGLHLKLVKEGDFLESEIPVFLLQTVHGMEFRNVVVVDAAMTDNMRYIAYTRSLEHLCIVVDE